MLLLRRIAGLAGLGALLITGGCASISNFQSAKPLGQGVAEATGAASYISWPHYSIEDSIITTPTFEFQARYGVTEKLDFGLKYSFPTGVSLDGKYCLFGAGKERGFFIATGLKAGYTSFPSDSAEDYRRIEYYVPAYFSLYPLKFLGLTVTPSYGGRFYTFARYYENLLGANMNLRIGTKFGVVIDYAVYRNFKTKFTEKQISGGAFIPFSQLFNKD